MSILTLNSLLNTPSHKPISMIKMASTLKLFLCVCVCISKHLHVLCVTFCTRQLYLVPYVVGQSLTEASAPWDGSSVWLFYVMAMLQL